MQKACGHWKTSSRSLEAHDFRICFTPLRRVLFTFPSRYLCAIGRWQVFSLGGWAPRIRAEFHVFRPTQDPSRSGMGSSHTGLSPAAASLSRDLCWPRRPAAWSCNPGKHASRFGLVRVRSPLLAESRLISVPRGTEMFHFPRYGLSDLWIQSLMMPEGIGLLHSETRGSEAACAYPRTIAACRVLHRPPSPRHPSCA